MGPRSLVFVILLHCAAASGGTVIVEPPMTRLVSTLEQVHRHCAGDGKFDACAKFIAFRLEARCATRGDLWNIEASARFRPWIMLYNIRQLPHEQEHVRDMRSLVSAYLAELEAIPFASNESCQTAAITARETFGEKMAEFAAASNRRLHHCRGSCGGARAPTPRFANAAGSPPAGDAGEECRSRRNRCAASLLPTPRP
jgi:hypothetical protein